MDNNTKIAIGIGATLAGSWYWANNSTSPTAVSLKAFYDSILDSKASTPAGGGGKGGAGGGGGSIDPLANPGQGFPGGQGKPCNRAVLAFADNVGVPCEAVRDYVIQYKKLPDDLGAFVSWANQKGWRNPNTTQWHWGELWWNPGHFGL